MSALYSTLIYLSIRERLSIKACNTRTVSSRQLSSAYGSGLWINISIAKRGMTIVLASHLLDEVEKICSHVVILEKGKKLHAGRVSEVLMSSEIIELAAFDMERLKQAVSEEDFVTDSREESGLLIVELSRHIDPAEINRLLTNKGVYVSHLAARKKSLENYFLELISE